jgi:hypothetical protein
VTGLVIVSRRIRLGLCRAASGLGEGSSCWEISVSTHGMPGDRNAIRKQAKVKRAQRVCQRSIEEHPLPLGPSQIVQGIGH